MTFAFDIDLGEEIRRAGGDPRRLAELGGRLAEEHARIAAALAEVCRWIDEGFFVEAVGFSEDAGNLVRRGRAVDDAITRISLDATSLPGALDRRRLDRLDVAYADVAAIEDLIAAHRRLSLSRAAADERLDALDPIRRRHRRHEGWAGDVDALERVALAELAEEIDRAAEIEDEAALERLGARLSRRHWGREIPDRLAATLRETRERLRRRRVEAAAEDLGANLHRAFAAMDATAVAEIEPRWRRLAAPDGTAGGSIDPGLAEAAESAFRWLASHREAEAADRRAAEAIAELERLLDGDAPCSELRNCLDRIAAAGATAPPRLAGRVEAAERRAASAGRRRRRGRIAAVAAVAILPIACVSYVWWRSDRDRRAIEAIEEVGRRVDRGEFDRAEVLLAELDADGVSGGFWSGDARDRWLEIERDARERIAEQVAQTERLETALAEIRAGLEADRDADPDGEGRLADLRRLQATAESVADVGDPRLDGPRSEIDARIDAISRRAAAAVRGELLEIESRLAGIVATGADGDPADVLAESAALAALAAEVAAISGSPAAGPAESEAARSLRERIDRRLAAAERRGEALDAFARRRRELPRTMDERTFLDRYRTLVDEHGDVLAAREELAAFEDGLASAQLAEAVAHWRRTASRSILANTPTDDPWHPPDIASARTIAAILAEHLSRHPGSPYASPAAKLSDLSEAIGRLGGAPGGPDDPAGLVAEALRATGFSELLRVPLANGGFVYRKVGGEGVFDNALAHSGDLAVPAGRLLPRTDVASPASRSAETSMPARLLSVWMPRIENASASRVRVELLGLVEAAAAAEESDPLLQLAFLESLHRALARLPMAGGPGANPAQSWLDELDRRTPPANAVDWAADAPRGREELTGPRRLARLELASMPDPALSRERTVAAWSELLEELRACTVVGTVEPAATAGTWRFVPIGAGGVRGRIEGRVVVADPRGATVFVPIAIEDGVAVFLGPEPPAAPHLVFER